jgi:lipoprotein-releasing system permease protein
MEKLVMMILLSLIFVVVGVNIFHSLKRTVYERMEEIGVLKSVGADGKAIQWIFIFEGILIGFTGAVTGILLGLLIAGNINALFRAIERITNFLLGLASSILLPLSGGEDFAIFSPRYYYLAEVPSRVLFQEVVSVFIFAVLISSLAAYLASRRAASIKPAEVLREE